MNSKDIASSAICAVLYAIVGYLSYLGIFTPAVGVVRFWPSVFIPAVFAVVFSPLVGGVGAAIGIFISDMMIHGNALLSLSVGVPANFIAFYLTGYLYEKTKTKEKEALIINFIEIGAFLFIIWETVCYKLLSWSVGMIYIGAMIVTFVIVLIYVGTSKKLSRRDISIIFSSNTGLLVGSTIIGLGIWLFSQAFVLPTGGKNLSFAAAILWMLWTYATEVPFLLSLTPFFVALTEKAIGKTK